MRTETGLLPGFDDPVYKCQAAFHALLQALSRPGRLLSLPAPEAVVPGLCAGSAAIALTLVDFETPVWLDKTSSQAADYLRFHCGCVIVDDPSLAQFAFARGMDSLPALSRLRLGTDEEPEDSTTLIVELEHLSTGGPWVLTGPGIEQEHRLSASELDGLRMAERATLAPLFPMGLDLFLTCDRQVAGISRTTRITRVSDKAGQGY